MIHDPREGDLSPAAATLARLKDQKLQYERDRIDQLECEARREMIAESFEQSYPAAPDRRTDGQKPDLSRHVRHVMQIARAIQAAGYAAELRSLDPADDREALLFDLLTSALAQKPEEISSKLPECLAAIPLFWVACFNSVAYRDALIGRLIDGDSPRTPDHPTENAVTNLPADEPAACAHSLDFRSVTWNGEQFCFTTNQAKIVKMLWGSWENGTPDVGGDTLITEADASAESMRHVFRSGGAVNPAWDTMIVAGRTKGTYRIADIPATSRQKNRRRR